MLKNLANYRIGNEYYFYVGENKTEVIVAKILNKDHMRLQLQFKDGTDKWYDSDRLSSVEKWLRKPQAQNIEAEKTSNIVVEKPTPVVVPEPEKKEPVVAKFISIEPKIVVENQPKIVEKAVAVEKKNTPAPIKTVEVTRLKVKPSMSEHKEILKEKVIDYQYLLKRFKRELRYVAEHNFHIVLNENCTLQQVVDAFKSVHM